MGYLSKLVVVTHESVYCFALSHLQNIGYDQNKTINSIIAQLTKKSAAKINLSTKPLWQQYSSVAFSGSLSWRSPQPAPQRSHVALPLEGSAFSRSWQSLLFAGDKHHNQHILASPSDPGPVRSRSPRCLHVARRALDCRVWLPSSPIYGPENTRREKRHEQPGAIWLDQCHAGSGRTRALRRTTQIDVPARVRRWTNWKLAETSPESV